MIALKKPLVRVIPVLGDPVVLTLDPETKMLRLREKGCRREYRLHFDTVFRLAVQAAEVPVRRRRGRLVRRGSALKKEV